MLKGAEIQDERAGKGKDIFIHEKTEGEREREREREKKAAWCGAKDRKVQGRVRGRG